MFSKNKRKILYDGDTKCFFNVCQFFEINQVRWAEIEHEGKNIIDEIYTDLHPNEGILQQVNLPRTSILKGRKGTGKSTIFQKSIADMKGNKDVITVYIDVKTMFDSATPTLSGTLKTEMSEEIKKYLIYKNFLFEVIKLSTEGFRNSIKSQNFLSRLAHSLNGTVIEVEEKKFIVDRHLRNGSVLISADNNEVYIVKGIYSSWREMQEGYPMPQIIEATLIPFGNAIIYNGIVVPSGVCLGRNMSEQSKQIYLAAKKTGRLHYDLWIDDCKVRNNIAEKNEERNRG